MSTRDAIGDRGQSIFATVLTRFHGGNPLFRVQFLGDKWPLIDFLVELVGPWKTKRPFFLVQVKATQLGYTKKGDPRLKVSVAKDYVKPLRGYRAPVFVAGIDEELEKVFIVTARGTRIKKLASMTTKFEVNTTTRRLLWTEVRDFWNGVKLPNLSSAFKEPYWN